MTRGKKALLPQNDKNFRNMALAITLGKLSLKELFSFGTAAISADRCLRGALGDMPPKFRHIQDLPMVVKARIERRRI